jgi:drug/metabolite transporter (DMT)-like permease
VGILFILISGAAFGLLPWFARIAYDSGANPMGMLAARFTLAAIGMVVIRLIRYRGHAWPKGKLALQLFLLGALGYAPQSSFFFFGIARIDVSLATVIFYTYPVLVVLASWIFLKHKPNVVMIVCLTVAVLGAALTAGQIKTGAFTGVLFMLGAAGWYTGFIIISSKIVAKAGSLTSLTYCMIGAACSHIIILITTDAHLPTGIEGWGAAVAAAYLCTIIAMGFFFAGVQRIGPGKSAVLSTIEPVVSIVVGVAALNETLNTVRAIGALLVMIGVSALAHFSRNDTK